VRRRDRGVDVLHAGEHLGAVNAVQPLQGDVFENRQQPVRADLLQPLARRLAQFALSSEPCPPCLAERDAKLRGIGACTEPAAHVAG